MCGKEKNHIDGKKILGLRRNKMTEKTTYQLLREEYDYLPETGLFIDKKTNKSVGQFYPSGYLSHYFKGKNYDLHRLIYCWYYGYFPEHQIDHINRCKVDNRIINLREVTATCNSRNKDLSIKNSSGISGINKHFNSWRVTIGDQKKRIHIGTFKHFINAVKARYYAENLFNYTECNPISSTVEYLIKNPPANVIDNTLPLTQTIQGEWDYFCLTKKEKIEKKKQNIKTTSYSNPCEQTIKGVNWIKQNQNWKVTINVNNKLIFIGQFKFFINAVKARAYAEKLFNVRQKNESSAVTYLKSITHLDNNDDKSVKKGSAQGEWNYFCLAKKDKLKLKTQSLIIGNEPMID